MHIKNSHFFGIVITGLMFTSCSPGQNPADGGTAKMNVRLTDAPGEYDEVNIDVQAVEIIYNDSDRVTMNAVRPGVYNLLDLTNGLDTLIATEDIPSGEISQIRLILGENNTVMVDSTLRDLNTPSAQQSGLKINFHETLVSGITYEVTLDFDASRSIVLTGNNKYQLKPVIRAFVGAISGSIEGHVNPDSAVSYTFVIDNTDTIGTLPDSTGYFRINGLPAGSHDVNFTALAPYTDQTVNGVNVTLGQVTDIDTVSF